MSIIQNFAPVNHDDADRHYRDIYYTQQVQPHHRASWTHEAVAGAAGFAAMHAYESHLRATGQQPTHALMKEILAGIAAAEVDKLVETKGLDWVDARKARHMAQQQAHHLANQRYQGGTGYEFARSMGGPSVPYNYGAGSPYVASQAPGFAGYAPYPQQGYGQQGYGGYGAPPIPQGYPVGGFPGGGGYGQPQPVFGDPNAYYAQQQQSGGGHHHHHHHQQW